MIKLSEDQKKGLHRKWNTFSPNSGEEGEDQKTKKKKKVFTRNGALFLSTALRSDAHQSQIIGGDADENHTQIVGGYTVKLLGGIYPQSSRVSAPLFMAFMLDVQQLKGTV